MTIKSLHIYPIKGLGGIELQEAQMLERGMEYDRRWMLVDMDGLFITQRTDARMALFHCELDDKLHVSHKGSRVSIDIEEYSSVQISAAVWESEVITYEVSSAVSSWFSEQLGTPCRLVKMVDQFDRYKELIRGPKSTKVSLADGYPYHIIGTASLDKLSKRLGVDIPANRFRANIIIETSVAHEEDTWDEILVGEGRLQVIKPCVRCLVVNIDQGSAKITKQPLKELSKYRSESNNVSFGANTICRAEGMIRVGDTLQLVD